MLESIVTSLEVSKKLRDIGVPQESVFYWQEFQDHEPRLVQGIPEHFNGTSVSAFTASELLNQLPEYVNWDDRRCFLRCGNRRGHPFCEYWSNGISQLGYCDEKGNEAEARAKTMIFLAGLKNINL